MQTNPLRLSTLLVAPTSTSARPTSFRPEMEVNGKSTYVLTAHLSHNEMVAVNEALRTVLDI